MAQVTVDRKCRLVLRHNQHLQVGIDIEAGELLHDKLLELDRLASRSAHYNPKITGFKKLAQHAKLNGLALHKLLALLTREPVAYRLVSI